MIMFKKLLLTIVFVLSTIPLFSQTGTHLNLDGTDDHIVLENEGNFDFTNQLTLEFWMRSSTTPQQWDALVAKGDDSWRIALGSDGKVGFAGSPIFSEVWSTTTVTNGNWHHIAAVYDGTRARLYVNGVEEGSVFASGDLNNSSFAVSIGENLQATGRYYQGDIDEVRIWNVARTAGQITNNSNCQLPYGGNRDASGQVEEGIVAYYTFNQGTASGINTTENTLTDSAMTSINNGTLNNFALSGSTSNWISTNSSSVTGITFTSSLNQSFCDGLNNGSISISPSGGTTPYTFQWSTSATTNQISNLQAGTYFLYGITDANGCTLGGDTNEAIATFTISNLSTLSYSASVNDVSCLGFDDGSITISASGGPVPYSYYWSDGSRSNSLVGLSPGTYTLNGISDAGGCTLGDPSGLSGTLETFTIATLPSPISYTSSISAVSCIDAYDGNIVITPSGGVAPYTFNWSNGRTTNSIASLAPGTYNLYGIRDSTGCTLGSLTSAYVVLEAFTIDDPSAVAAPVVESPLNLIQGTVAAPLTATSGGTGLIWYNTQTAVSALSSAPVPDTTSLGSTSYWVSSTNAAGCESSRVELVVVVSPPTSHLDFDGIDDYAFDPLSVPFSDNLKSYTKEAWIKPTDITGERQIFSFDLESGSNVAGKHYLWLDDGVLKANLVSVSNPIYFIEDTVPVPVNEWTHVAVTVDETTNTMKLFKNGNLISTKVYDITETQLFFGVYLGAKNSTESANFKGGIDDARIWDRALSEAEIAGRMNCELRGDEQGLLHYYKLNNRIFDNTGLIGGQLTLGNFANTGITSNSVSGSPVVSGVSNPLPPTTDFLVTYDFNETSSPLTAVGSNLLWYSDLSSAGSSTAPTPKTFISGITKYWVSSSNANGCESKRVLVNVFVSPSSDTNCWKTISSESGSHSLAIAQDGSLWGWGANNEGQLATSSITSTSVPIKIGTDTDWKDVKTGISYTLALKENGTLWATGLNNVGQLGLGDTTSRNQLVQVGTDSDWTVINTKYDSSYAIKSNGTLWSWGSNLAGQLGLGNTDDQNQPMQAGNDADWESIATNSETSFAIKTDGTLWSSGSGISGSYAPSFVYSQLGSDTDWYTISNGLRNVFVGKDDSSLWGVGSGRRGEMAIFLSTLTRNTFTRVPGNNWIKVQTGSVSGVALKSDGTLWAWGANAINLGLSNDVRSQLVQIDTRTDWKDFSLSGVHSLVALNNDGNLYSLGTNGSGVLGLGDTNARSSFEILGCPINLDGFSLHFEEVTDPALGSNFSIGSLAFADVDNDGDQDLYTTGLSSLVPTSVLYENDGSGRYTASTNSGVGPTFRCAVAFADVDNDGDQDLLVSGLGSTYQPETKLYVNDGNGGFTEDTNTLFPDTVGGSIAFEYINNDAYVDVVITGNLTASTTDRITKMYLNTGTGSFTEVLNTPFDNVDRSAIAFADINNDTYPDLLITGESDSSFIAKLYINDGLGDFTLVSGTPFEGVVGSVAFADVNNDSYNDVMITGLKSDGNPIAALYLNSATTTFTQAANTPFEPVSNSAIGFSDVDDDGDMDVLITGSAADTRIFITKLYANDGTGKFTQVNNLPFDVVSLGKLDFADIDNDGDQDVVIMGSNRFGAGTKLYRNLSNRASWVGGENASWTNVNNWGDGSLPTLSEEIRISPTATNLPVIGATDVVQVGAMNIDQNASIEIHGVLKVNTKLNNDGLITFKSDASSTGQLDQFNAKYSGSGSVMAERFIPAGKRAFRFISPSVTSTSSIYENWQEGGVDVPGLGTHITGIDGVTNGFDATITNNPSLFTFDNTVLDQSVTSPWSAATSTSDNLVAGSPYRLFIRGDRTVDLTTNLATPDATVLRSLGDLHFGEYSPALSAGNGNYSFIGNPYQAAVDFNQLTVGGDLNANFIYVWDSRFGSTGTYVTVDVSDGSDIYDSPVNQFIQPGQAFFVRNNLNVTSAPSITFTEQSKAVLEEQLVTFSTTSAARLNVQLLLNDSGVTSTLDGISLRFRESYLNEVNDNDAGKLWHPGENLAIRNGSHWLSIEQRLPPLNDEVIPLSIYGSSTSNYKLRASLQNWPDDCMVYVQDLFLNTITLLTPQSDYDFSVDTGISDSVAAGRFNLLFEDTTLGNADPMIDNLILYPNPANTYFQISGIQTEQEVRIMDLLGKEVLVVEDYFNERPIDISQLKAGVYIVKITAGKNQSSSFKLVKN
jgi:alpha-tubulin suppressor-like RCC1 family protein